MNNHRFIRLVLGELQWYYEGITLRFGVWWGTQAGQIPHGIGFYFCPSLDYGRIPGKFLFVYWLDWQHRFDLHLYPAWGKKIKIYFRSLLMVPVDYGCRYIWRWGKENRRYEAMRRKEVRCKFPDPDLGGGGV